MAKVVSLVGDLAVAARLGRLQLALPIILGSAIMPQAEGVMSDSKNNYVPIKDGILRGTGHVEGPFFGDGVVQANMLYGGPAAPYARKQHENRKFFHPRGRSWRYLSIPLKLRRPMILEGIASGVAAGIRSVTGAASVPFR